MPEAVSIAIPHFEHAAAFDPSIDAAFRRIRANYLIEQPEVVTYLLENHPSLVELLLEAVPHLRDAFGDGPQLKLRALADDGPYSLYATVLWTGELESARAARERFDASWWLENSSRDNGLLVFDFELA